MTIRRLKSSWPSGKAARAHGKQALYGGHIGQQHQVQGQCGLACDVCCVFDAGHAGHKQAIGPGGLVQLGALQRHGRGGGIALGQAAQVDVGAA